LPVPRLTKRYENVHEYTDLPAITREQIQHFFEHYKDLEPGKWVKLIGWGMPPRHGSLSSKRSDGPRRGNSRPVNILLQSFAEAQQFASAACRLYR